MSEDVSATMRVGITVILVAALVATVLNLMVMSNSLLSGGQTTLQSGIDSVSTQEFATYDNSKVSGTQVATALSLFQGRDIAVIVRTKALAEAFSGEQYAINYGALVTNDGKPSGSGNKAQMLAIDGYTIPSSCTKMNDISGDAKTAIVSGQAKTAVIIEVGKAIARANGNPFYTAYLHNTSGLVDSSYDTIGTTVLGNYAYILSSARFSSVLIKDPTGSIVGIYFEQLQ